MQCTTKVLPGYYHGTTNVLVLAGLRRWRDYPEMRHSLLVKTELTLIGCGMVRFRRLPRITDRPVQSTVFCKKPDLLLLIQPGYFMRRTKRQQRGEPADRKIEDRKMGFPLIFLSSIFLSSGAPGLRVSNTQAKRHSGKSSDRATAFSPELWRRSAGVDSSK
jgi:hypothetical protein